MLIQLLVIQVITFIVLIVVLRIAFYKQLNSALTRLKKLHEENLAREEELKKEVEKIKLERESELKRAKEEAERLVKEAKAKSEKIGADIQEAAKLQAQRTELESKLGMERLGKELMTQYQDHAIDLSIEILKSAFTGQGQEALQNQLISELIDEIKNIDHGKFTVKTKEVKISSAYPLASNGKKELAHVLSEKVGVAVELHESQDPDIIAGLIIQIGPLTIDGSLKNKLKKIVPYLRSNYEKPKDEKTEKVKNEKT